jgi:hypothetical protein
MSAPIVLPDMPQEYSQSVMRLLVASLRRWFAANAQYQDRLASNIFVDPDKFPTEADLANLRVGQVYRDTAAGNVLKVKV